MVSRNLPTRSPLTLILALAMGVFLLLGLRTFFFPASAAAYYGIPAGAPETLAYVQAYGARNIAISLVAISLLLMDFRAGIVAVLAAAALIASLDFCIVTLNAGLQPAYKHIAYVVVLLALAIVTARSGRAHRVAGVSP